jgi:hypothetical protein
MNKLETGAQDSPFCIATRPRAGRSKNGVRLMAEASDFYLLQRYYMIIENGDKMMPLKMSISDITSQSRSPV